MRVPPPTDIIHILRISLHPPCFHYRRSFPTSILSLRSLPVGFKNLEPCAFSHSLSRLPAPLRGDRRVRVRQEDDGGGGDGQQCQSSRVGVGSRNIVKARHRLRNEKGRTTATENFCCNDFLFFLNIFFCLGHFFGCMITFTFFDNMEISSTRS